jgi:hypothetical protein
MKILDLFSFWKTVPELADEIGASHWTVQKWKQRRRIPVDAWAAVILAAKKKGKDLTTDDLLAMHSRKSSRRVA